VGVPDILGCYKGTFVGIEVKSVAEVPRDGMAPRAHPFSTRQIRELKEIDKNGGIAIGAVICGKRLYWAYPEDINNEGAISCHYAETDGRLLKGEWDITLFLEDLWMSNLIRSR